MFKHLKEGGVKRNKGFCESGRGGVHHNKYDAHYMNQWIRTSKVT